MSCGFIRAILVGLLLLHGGALASVALSLEASPALDGCAGHSGGGDDGRLPCCPPGSTGHEACGTACQAVPAGISQAFDVVAYATARVSPGELASLHASQSYTPANPPPIG